VSRFYLFPLKNTLVMYRVNVEIKKSPPLPPSFTPRSPPRRHLRLSCFDTAASSQLMPAASVSSGAAASCPPAPRPLSFNSYPPLVTPLLSVGCCVISCHTPPLVQHLHPCPLATTLPVPPLPHVRRRLLSLLFSGALPPPAPEVQRKLIDIL